MQDSLTPFVHAAELQLEPGTDPAAVGAAVTTALCGHWDHEGACRWPHNNAIETSNAVAGFRTLFVAPAAEEQEVRERIERSLRAGPGWSVLDAGSRPVTPSERPLAQRLASVEL